MSTSSYSSINTHRRARTLHDDIDRSVYTVGHTLASIVNDPRTASQPSGGFWGLGHDSLQNAQPPPLDPARYPAFSKADVQRYIDLVHGTYERFIRDRQSLEAFDAQHQDGTSDSGAARNQGEPFMAAMQAVPMEFFQEGFFDTWDDFFKQYCKDQSTDELYEQIDQLSKNLDVVELQLLREVASRSTSFFQAAAGLERLLTELGGCVGTIKGLRRSLSAADEDMYSTAVSVKALQARRSNLQATLDMTKGLEEVAVAQHALDCLLESQDYAAALELLEQMKQLLEQPGLLGLQCVRHLPPRLLDSAAAVEAAIANDLLATIKNYDIPRVVAQAASDAEAQPADASSGSDAPGSHDLWQLPAAPAALPSGAPGADSTTAANEQLQEKLLPLAVGLYRSDRLTATLQQYKQVVGEEVKAAVREAVQRVLPVLLSAAGDGLPQAGQQGEMHLTDQLQVLHHGSFMVLLHAAARVVFSCVDQVLRVTQLLEAILTGINASTSQLSMVRKVCGSALQLVVDVGLGRWVKLLGARSAAHVRLKQYELKQLLDLSEQVAAYTEAAGGRPLGTFRAALQSQCKSLLDHQHQRCMNQLQHLLESEQWGAVEVPGSFQAIVDRLVARCGAGAALLDGRTAPGAAAAAAAGVDRAAGGVRSAEDAAAAAGAGPAEQRQAQLLLSGKSFHLVNSALMLLKLVEEYLGLYDLMPQFGAEIVHRELELLKLFNSQTAALVLGAGAMRTAGLRSISAKQLALSCQAVAMLATLLPLLRAGSLALVSQPRRALLIPEFDRLLQDLTMHMDEVHSKLVDIMRDRLHQAVQVLPEEIRNIASSKIPIDYSQASPTISLLTKQLATLRGVLGPILLKDELEFVFGAVARAFSDGLSELFEGMLSQSGACEPIIQANALSMLQAFRELPLDPARATNYASRLSTTYTKHFGLPPWDQEKLGHKISQQQQQQQQKQQQQQQQEQGEEKQRQEEQEQQHKQQEEQQLAKDVERPLEQHHVENGYPQALLQLQAQQPQEEQQHWQQQAQQPQEEQQHWQQQAQQHEPNRHPGGQQAAGSIPEEQLQQKQQQVDQPHPDPHQSQQQGNHHSPQPQAEADHQAQVLLHEQQPPAPRCSQLHNVQLDQQQQQQQQEQELVMDALGPLASAVGRHLRAADDQQQEQLIAAEATALAPAAGSITNNQCEHPELQQQQQQQQQPDGGMLDQQQQQQEAVDALQMREHAEPWARSLDSGEDGPQGSGAQRDVPPAAAAAAAAAEAGQPFLNAVTSSPHPPECLEPPELGEAKQPTCTVPIVELRLPVTQVVVGDSSSAISKTDDDSDALVSAGLQPPSAAAAAGDVQHVTPAAPDFMATHSGIVAAAPGGDWDDAGGAAHQHQHSGTFLDEAAAAADTGDTVCASDADVAVLSIPDDLAAPADSSPCDVAAAAAAAVEHGLRGNSPGISADGSNTSNGTDGLGSVVLHPSAGSSGLLEALWAEEQQLTGELPSTSDAAGQQLDAPMLQQLHHQADDFQQDGLDSLLSTANEQQQQQQQQQPAEVVRQQCHEVLQQQPTPCAAAADEDVLDGLVAANGASHIAEQQVLVGPAGMGQDVPAAGAVVSTPAMAACASWDPLNAASEPPGAARVEGGPAGPS